MTDIRILKDTFVDRNRQNRVVPYKLYYPENVDTMPVVIWSHGFGGSRDGAAFLSRYLAERGFALLHLTHDGTDTSLWEGKPGHPWDILRKTTIPRAVTLNRFKDIPFVIDHLKDLDVSFDTTKIGMSGHSFGALSAQVACGQMFPDENGTLQSYADDRIIAGLSYSPVRIDQLGPDNADVSTGPDTVYGMIKKPMLYMTGTQDNGPIDGAPYTDRFLIFDHTGAEQKYLMVKNGGDHMIYNGTRGKLGNQDNRERLEEIIQVTSYHFWNAYLRDDTESLHWLQNAGDYVGDDGVWKIG